MVGSSRCDVLCDAGAGILAETCRKQSLTGEWRSVILALDSPGYIKGVEARAVSEGEEASFRLGAQILPC